MRGGTSQPANATQWSVRSRAAQTGMSKSTLARYFALFGSAAPHQEFQGRDANSSIIGRIRNAQVMRVRSKSKPHGRKGILSGTVRSRAERGEAGIAAWAASDVSEVDNCLKVSHAKG